MQIKEQIKKRINRTKRFFFKAFVNDDNDLLYLDNRYGYLKIISFEQLKSKCFSGSIEYDLENYGRRVKRQFELDFKNKKRYIFTFDNYENYYFIKNEKLEKINYFFHDIDTHGNRYKLVKYTEEYEKGSYNYSTSKESYILKEDFFNNNFENIICLTPELNFKNLIKTENGYSIINNKNYFMGVINGVLKLYNSKNECILNYDKINRKFYNSKNEFVYEVEDGYSICSLISSAFERKDFDCGFITNEIFIKNENIFKLTITNNLKTTKIINMDLKNLKTKEIKLNAKNLFIDENSNYRRTTNSKDYIYDKFLKKFVLLSGFKYYSNYFKNHKIKIGFDIEYIFNDKRNNERNYSNKRKLYFLENEECIFCDKIKYDIEKTTYNILKKNVEFISNISYHLKGNYYLIELSSLRKYFVLDDKFNFINELDNYHTIDKKSYQSIVDIKGLGLTEQELKILKIKASLA